MKAEDISDFDDDDDDEEDGAYNFDEFNEALEIARATGAHRFDTSEETLEDDSFDSSYPYRW